jgi:pre-mRNA-splicing factor SYF2
MQNHKEVIEEDKRNKLPANWESRKRQAEWIIQDEAAKKEAEAKVSTGIYIFNPLLNNIA